MPKEILFYDSFSRWSAEYFINKVNEFGSENFTVRLNTDGGSVIDAFAIIGKLSEMNSDKVVVDGRAFSMGAFFLPFFKDRVANNTSEFMFHKAAYPSWMEPTADEQRRLNATNELLKSQMEDANIDQNLIDRIFQPDIREDVFLTAEQALAAGVITEIKELKVAEQKELNANYKVEMAAYFDGDRNLTQAQNKPKSNNNTPIPTSIMDIHELQQKHPALFAQVETSGVTKERKRTNAFLGYVKVDDKTAAGRALKGVKEGEDFMEATGELNQLLMAGNRAEAMQSENAGDLGADPKPNTPQADAGGDAAAKAAALKAEEDQVEAILAGRGGK